MQTSIPSPPSAPDAIRPSELVPYLSGNISIWRSRALVPLAVTALTCVVLFTIKQAVQSREEIFIYMNVVAFYLVFAMFMGLYFYVGERKGMLWYAVPALVTWFQLKFFLDQYIYVFRTLLPGDMKETSFATAFTSMFFGAGLMEELMKAVPILAALALALALRRRGRTGGFLGRGLALEGPVDGLLMGAAAGGAFILVETITMYVPLEFGKVMRQPKSGEAMAVLSSFLLLVPRVLNGVIGHMAYAGIAGYFIGLGVSHPNRLFRLLLLAWLVSSVLHAFWNSVWWLFGGWGSYVAAAVTLFVFLGFVLKAKQLEVSRLGVPADGHSILAASPAPGSMALGEAGVVPRAQAGLAGAFTRIVTAIERLFGVKALTTTPNPGAVPVLPPMPEHGLSIGTAAGRYALVPGAAVDFSTLFAAEGVPAGALGAVGGSPDRLALANAGQAVWTALAPDGAARPVATASSIDLVDGLKLVIGAASIEVRSY